MGFRFRKSFKILPGIKFNINKKSFGMTFGTKGAHYTINSKGTRTKSVGIPGTGLSYVDVENPERRSSTPQGDGDQGATRSDKGKKRGIGCLSLILAVFAISAIISLFSGHFGTFFGSLLIISVMLAIISLFNPKLAFWTKKKTKGRAFLGYAVLSIILFLAVGATASSNQPSTNSTDSQTAATSDSSSGSDNSSSQADSSVWSDASSSADSSNNDTANSSASASSASQAAVAVAPSAGSSSSVAATSKPVASAPKKASAPASSAAPKPAPTPAVTGSGLNVSPGQIASVSAKGSPNAPASIQVIYSSGPSTAAGLVSKTTDGSGNVSWTWKVGTRTKPGDYPVNITIGGKTITQTLHVN
ncbi:DUF4236 domain-containing protein [Sporolactobacillus sp. KGMB 08714]|uniref:DUF4236 domain-containing protein n=1 Tax=Sporolactobacillus sp. KGMB 08714 TaxID=3064704 RepID=UPI002FBD59B2